MAEFSFHSSRVDIEASAERLPENLDFFGEGLSRGHIEGLSHGVRTQSAGRPASAEKSFPAPRADFRWASPNAPSGLEPIIGRWRTHGTASKPARSAQPTIQCQERAEFFAPPTWASIK